MKREEQIKQAAQEMGLWQAGEAMFQLGVEWADEHPKEGKITLRESNAIIAAINYAIDMLPSNEDLYQKFSKEELRELENKIYNLYHCSKIK